MGNIHLIAIIKQTKRSKSILGARILDDETGDTKDVPLSNLIQVMSKGVRVENCKISGNSIEGTNGSLDRFPLLIVNKGLAGDSPLVVLSKLDGGFKVCDWKGTIKKLSNDDVVKYSKQNGIANGKLCSLGSDNITVSSIKGTYKKEEVGKQVNNVKRDSNENSKKEITESKGSVHKDNESGNTRVRGTIGQFDKITINKPAIDRLSEIDEVSGLNIEQKMTRAKLSIRNLRPFYYCVLMQLDSVPVQEEDGIVDTMCVSVDKLFYNVDFVKKLSMPEIVFVLLHEVCHIAMEHILRLSGRDPEKWNIATDLFINKFLCEELNCYQQVSITKEDALRIGVKMPEEGLYDPNVNIMTDTPETIYEKLPKNNGGSGSGNDGNSDNNGNSKGNSNSNNNSSRKSRDLVASEEDSNMSAERLQSRAKSILENAAMNHKQAGGDMDGFLERYVAKALAPKINWKNLLKRYLIDASSKVYTYARPDRRFISRGTILPGPKSTEFDKLKGVKVCIDTSGSISNKDLGIALAQIEQLLKVYKAEAEMIYWDTRVRSTGNFKTAEDALKIKPMGGGGTDVNCVFEYLSSKNCKVPASVVLVFTDGCFGRVDDKYRRRFKDTIWILQVGFKDSFTKPFGKVADLKVQ